jgi:translation initiation factor eIF-2B subunit delta
MEVISPLYDLTPASLITVLVTEVGLIPPGAISTLSGGEVMVLVLLEV